jgi:hypothetical protein
LRACLLLGDQGDKVAQVQSQTGAAVAKSVPNVQARLILQDPSAFEQATQPALRSSMELVSEPTALMEREKAREMWENLSLEPEVAQERQAERKRLLTRADQLARDAAAAKARSAALEAELARAKEDRLNHPVVYAGAAGLLALGALWFLERRKRLKLQDKELDVWAQYSSVPAVNEKEARPHQETGPHLKDVSSVFSLEEPSDFGQEDNRASQAKAQTQVLEAKPEWVQSPAEKKSSATPSPVHEAQEATAAEPSFLKKTKQSLGKLWTRPTDRHALNSSGYSTQSRDALHTQSFDYSTVMYSESVESTRFQHDQGVPAASSNHADPQLAPSSSQVIYSTEQDNIELLTSIRARRSAGESAMEHLLELRMAASGLSALGRPMAAIDLLQAHIDADPQTCAWAYLECMQLCEQMDERDIFESIRKRYRQQFNRMAPYWYEPNANVIGLDGYARATSELCTAWSQGYQHTREVLTSWLTGPQLGRKLVQLPAYHDLFDLYEMLEFLELGANAQAMAPSFQEPAKLEQNLGMPLDQSHFAQAGEVAVEFVPTVSLLDLDYEFSSDVTLEEREVAQSEKAVTIVKPGNFSVDFNVAGTQLGGLFSMPAELDKK